jgi:TonB family protein
MKRTLMSGLLTSVGLSAATLTGTVHDPSGNAVASATVTVQNPDTGSKQETATDADGKFSLSGAASGQYILKVEKPGFATVLREFDLGGNSSMDRQLTMSPEGSQQSAADLVTDNDNPAKVVAIGGRVAQSNLTERIQPTYPTAAKAAGTQGTVQIKATISKDGIPVDLQVVSSPSSDLSESALESVRQWRYRPTLLNGAPVEVTTTVIVNYTLAP